MQRTDRNDREAAPLVRAGLGNRLFAAFQKWGSARYAPLVHDRKRKLFESLHGTVLEIGAGTGTNFDYYPAGLRWIGVEPNAYMQAHLRHRAASLGIADIDLRFGAAERLPADDRSVDAVVSTLVLCSVDDVAKSLAEVRRVLKPGGRFFFLEHVAAPRGSTLRRVQSLVKPLWMCIGDGCRPDRETLADIDAAGFAVVHAERFDVPVPVVSPHIAGIACV